MRAVFLGAFPPPVGGAAKNNELIFQALRNADVRIRKISVSSSGYSHARSLGYHLRRIIKNVAAFVNLVFSGGADVTLYVVPDGGYGLYYTLIHFVAATFVYRNVVIHHRTFLYIDKPVLPMRLIVWRARSRTVHIFLSDEMADKFQRRYGAVAFKVATNACFASTFSDELDPSRSEAESDSDGSIRLGHLSNLCQDKGFFLVVKLFEALHERGQNVQLHLAGPVLEPAVRVRMDQLLERYGERVRYFGPTYGEAKQAFYRTIDLFVFPTLFAQEAQPNVIYEALAAGVPVLATPRACIPEMLEGESGETSPCEDGFVGFAIKKIEQMSFSPQDRAQRKNMISAKMRLECEISKRQYVEVFRLFGVSDARGIAPWMV